MRRQLIFPAVPLLLAAAALAGCGEPDQPFAVTVTPSTVLIDALGDTKQLKATVTNEKGTELTGAIVTWTSSAPTVATVSDGGLVTAAGLGSAEITAEAGPAKDNATATVTQTATQVEATSGAQQTGPVNQQLPQVLTVRVRDRLNNGIADLAVSFTVSTDGGSVSPSSATTDAQGQASTTWTFGTKSGSFQVIATMSGTAQTVVFTGKANPGPAVTFSKAGGDDQYAYRGSKVDTLIAVRVRDQYSNGVPNHLVQFATEAGNGAPDSTVALTDSTGVARSGWRMPDAIATVTLQVIANASAGGPLIGSPLSFTAISHGLRVTSVTPSPVVEGQSATLDGSGFDPNPAGNLVTIEGVAVTVTAASANQLTVTVPASDCKPARGTSIRVTAGGIPASPFNVTLNPPSFVSLAAGQQLLVRDPAAFCFQFPAAATGEEYLIGVQSVSENASDLTAIKLTGAVTPSAISAAQVGAQPAARAWPGHGAGPGLLDPDRLRRWLRHRRAELEQRELDQVTFEALRGQRPARVAAAATALVPPDKVVGDTIKTVRISSGGSCGSFTEITTVIRAKGTNAFFLEDVANPAGGFTSSHFTGFNQQYDNTIYPAVVAEFGAPVGDTDGNGRIVIVMTREVNRRGSFGFTTSCDFAARATSPASNEGEFFYAIVPDPAGTVNNDTVPLNFAAEVMPTIIAHEPVHVIQFTRRMAAGASMVAIWLAEGQATLGEEIAGHAADSRSAGQNYGLDIAFNADDVGIDWYASLFGALGLYFGWDPYTSGDLNGRAANAPHECTWLSIKPQAAANWPCTGGADPYAAPWALLRWISDQFGPSYTGGEPGIQTALIDNTANGYALVEAVIGKPMDSLLAQWAAMLYADDRVAGLAPALRLPSWNLFNIYYGTLPDGGFLRHALRLTPAALTYSTFTRDANVRAGSNYYALISGTNRPATAVRARDGAGGYLPAHMRYWIVRIE